MEKINSKNCLKSTFSERRDALFREAEEICCRQPGSEMAVVVLSRDNEPYAYGNPSVNKVLDRFLGEGTSSKLHDDDNDDVTTTIVMTMTMMMATNTWNARKREKVKEIKRLLPAPDKNWGLEELLKYKAFMQRLKAKVDSKIDDMKRREANKQ